MTLDYSSIKAVVFDLDNTLVSSSLNFTSIRHDIGCPQDHDLLEFADNLSCDKQKSSVHQTIVAHEMSDAQNAEVMEGCHELLTHLAQHNLYTGIVTRNCIEAATLKIHRLKLSVNELICREHFPPKPAPDSLLALADLWSLNPSHILYVGDYIYDIQAANNANMPSCLITHHQPTDYQHLATVCVPQLTDLHRLFASHHLSA
ncbi:HAD-IA family hydrolase [Vibrio astriarenae]|uniref:HAD-IA family hydrolase n=1 Tax=Vibrio astriarenae TaxID=1481923 RepID=A0A7Z2T7T8_9VIBR|nr:HAD-IA family hydrolase [Vibrio astriarenae]QIA65865.1 HAD-IA family hydrolase [Vibrio astriarenae]